jgi:hypothetical protein
VVSSVVVGLIPFRVGSFEWVSAEESGVMIARIVKYNGTSMLSEMIPNTLDMAVHR